MHISASNKYYEIYIRCIEEVVENYENQKFKKMNYFSTDLQNYQYRYIALFYIKY